MKKTAIVSACLLGEHCRYDGKIKTSHETLHRLEGYRIIPFCPEAPLFGTPRERISLTRAEGKIRIITDQTRRDVTPMLYHEILRFMTCNPRADIIILKSKSPSCGLGTTPIMNGNAEVEGYGNGIAAHLFLERYPDSLIGDETSLIPDF